MQTTRTNRPAESAPRMDAPPRAGSWSAAITATGALVVAGAVMLSWVALFNGAPLVFSDTLGYASAALKREVPGLFSIFYSVLILPLHQGVTLWPVVFVQGAILAHLLYLTMRCVSGNTLGKMDAFFIIAALCVFSSLPWITGQILPDALTSTLLLGLFVLAFCADQLRRWELLYVAALTTASIAAHFSHVPIAAGLIVLCVGLKMIFREYSTGWAEWSARLLIPFVAAVGAMIAVNWADSRTLGLSRNSNVFLLAKWIHEGPALSYLKQVCPSAGYKLCAHVGELDGVTHDDLKWGMNSPFQQIGTFDEIEPEARSIVRATLRAYPIEILQRAMADTARQLLRFQAGDGLSTDFAKLVAKHLAPLFGPDVGFSLVQSRQGRGLLPIAEIRLLHMVGLGIGLGLCVWSMVARRDLVPGKFVTLSLFIFAGLIWNATVTGALSGPYDRYLARIIWLVCFVGLLGLCFTIRFRKSNEQSSSG
jgi:hypothetical protein